MEGHLYDYSRRKCAVLFPRNNANAVKVNVIKRIYRGPSFPRGVVPTVPRDFVIIDITTADYSPAVFRDGSRRESWRARTRHESSTRKISSVVDRLFIIAHHPRPGRVVIAFEHSRDIEISRWSARGTVLKMWQTIATILGETTKYKDILYISYILRICFDLLNVKISLLL